MTDHLANLATVAYHLRVHILIAAVVLAVAAWGLRADPRRRWSR